jgi:hypothetical protein
MKNISSFLNRHDWIMPLLIVVLLAASVYGGVSYVQTKARNQAIARAHRMDGKVFTITAVANNLVGDTKLILTDENGREAGWIAMYMANPFNEKINPLFLAFSDPNGRLPIPMKVRTRFRPEPWTSKVDGFVKDNYTGSFLEFEIL